MASLGSGSGSRQVERGNPQRPGLLLRWFFQVPLLLHRVGVRGFERIVGIDWIVVTTTGRRTGRPHTVMLDVTLYDEARHTWYVSPAYGRAADWVRNALAEPRVEVEFRGRRCRARVDDASGPEGADAMLRFIRTHPRYARVVIGMVGLVDRLDLPDDELRAGLLTTMVLAMREEGATA